MTPLGASGMAGNPLAGPQDSVGLGRGGPGGPGGPGERVSQELLAFLVANRGSAEYLVAVNSSMAAAPIILETRLPVVAMGGFSGGDPAPTAEGLAELVTNGRLRFVMAGGRGGPGGGGPGGVSSERSAWVQANCPLVDLAAYAAAGAGSQLYDCAPASAVVPTQH